MGAECELLYILLDEALSSESPCASSIGSNSSERDRPIPAAAVFPVIPPQVDFQCPAVRHEASPVKIIIHHTLLHFASMFLTSKHNTLM